MNVVGLMSGTSADGIEVVVVNFDGQPPGVTWKLLAHRHVPLAPDVRAEVLACVRPETGRVDRVCTLNARLGEAFARAVLQVVPTAGLTLSDIAVIGSHGQTVWHAPETSCTLQLGEPAIIAERTGRPVVSGFRARDLAAGGQGAPLVSLLDQVLFGRAGHDRAFQNIGGIGNVTFLSASEEAPPIAFDTGPGNMLIDDLVQRASNNAEWFDRDGARAARGTVDIDLLATLLADPFFGQSPPKTTGRERFGAQFGATVWQAGRARGLSADDVIATATALTAHSIADAYRRFLPRPPAEVLVSGGGAHNHTLMDMLTQLLAPAHVHALDDLGLPGDAKEAMAFALLAYETWHGRPGNVPSATGARSRVILGSITPAGPVPAEPRGLAGSTLTEARNPRSAEIDTLPTLDMLRLMNAEDQDVPRVVGNALPALARAVDAVAERMQRGGRLIYAGSGTSGRLGVLDATECTPTFSTPPGLVLGLIAGGHRALTEAVEGAEDDEPAAERDLAEARIGPHDSLVGIAASGRTPYVLAALRVARRLGALTISVACNHPSPAADLADIAIALPVGPEVIAGSTRLKAGTAQKLALNALSTAVMVRLGKTYGNLMVDVQPTNAKLRERARRIVADATGLSVSAADALLELAQGEVKTAIVAHLGDMEVETARERLARTNGVVRLALSV